VPELLVPVRGTPLAVDDPGGSGRSFLWAHGLTSSRAREDRVGWFDWRAALPGWRVVRYDARGHGRSAPGPGPDAYRWPTLARDLVAVADALDLDRPLVAGGASMGCATVLHAAVADPSCVDALVLAIPPTAWATRAAQADLYRAGADLVAEAGLDAYLEVARSRPVPELFADVADLVAPDPDVPVEVLPDLLRGAGASDLPPPEALAALDVPALVLAWETDPVHPVDTAERLSVALPRAELHVAATLDEVRRWGEVVAGFLDRG
jgi:pimeloyl-ACP methyl ester carboxylesterase